MTQIIDGKKISTELKEELKQKVEQYKKEGIEITLAVIQVGNDKASSVYVGNKKKACEFMGFVLFLTNYRIAQPKKNCFHSFGN